jgi:lipopolysaccharide transport system permease protein
MHMLEDMFRDLVGSRELAMQLAIRDIRAQYRQTALGLLWAFILPLAHTITWIFLNGSGIVTLRDTVLPYPIFVFTGTMIWAIFMDAIDAPLKQTFAAKPMLSKLNFPREAIVVSGIYQTLFNSGIRIALMIGLLFILHIYPGWSLLLLPLGILALILAGTVLGLLLTPVGILYTDVGKSLPLLMQFLMYLTPVVFPIPNSGWAADILRINPLTPLVLNTRNWLTGFPPEKLPYFIMVNVMLLGLLFAVWIVYRIAMPILIERMSA